MTESERISEKTNHVSLQMNTSSPIDLLQRFISENNFPGKFPKPNHKEEGNIELSLGLSLNGRFGVDPKTPNSLIRSSSISDFNLTNENKNKNRACLSPVSPYTTSLTRTSSLPAEPEEEWRKRKEIQSLRRMDAKRRRLEKLKNVVRPPRDCVNFEENREEISLLQSQSSVPINGFQGLEGLQTKPLSQGSIGSQGSGSSGISDFESQPILGTIKLSEARSPASVQSLPEKNEQKPLLTRGSTLPAKFSIAPVENKSMKGAITENGAKETVKNAMLDMPSVSTRGDGPNGKRIEGFLYRYGNGEEVRIVCVCHGSFLSPAEFVKHAGGSDVAHPLRHIVVNPPSPL